MPPHMLVNTQLCQFPFQFKGILLCGPAVTSLVHSSSTLTHDSFFLSPQHFPSHPRSISISISLRKWKQSAENLYYHVSYQLAPATTHLLLLLLYDRPGVLQSKPLTPLTSELQVPPVCSRTPLQKFSSFLSSSINFSLFTG